MNCSTNPTTRQRDAGGIDQGEYMHFQRHYQSTLNIETACFVRPHHAEVVSGDSVVVIRNDKFVLAAVIDGLGVGPTAQYAARCAHSIINECATLSPASIILRCHMGLQQTCGATIGILKLEQGEGRYVGVGNTGLFGQSQYPLTATSLNGIVGHDCSQIHEYCFQYSLDDVYCLYTDGINHLMSLELVDRSQLFNSCRQLIEKYGRLYDDASIILISIQDLENIN